MPIASPLKKVYQKSNLHLAWDRLVYNPDGKYKNHFRDVLNAYSLGLEKNLFELSQRLNNNSYEPSSGVPIYFPKSSGLLRKYTLLTIEDQIVYQAFANIIAQKTVNKLSKNYYKKVFSNILEAPLSGKFYKDYLDGYEQFTKAIVQAHDSGNTYIVGFDLTAFYDSIDHQILKQCLHSMSVEPAIYNELTILLTKWTEISVNGTKNMLGHGIPQGPLSSPILAEIVLHRFDKLFEKEKSIHYFRYVDDIKVLGVKEEIVRRELIRLDYVSKAVGLFPQGAKVQIRKIKDIWDEVKSVSPVWIADETDPALQFDLHKKIVSITKRYSISNESHLRYALAKARPNSKLNTRVIELLARHPHLYQDFLNYLSKTKRLGKAESRRLLHLIKKPEQYYSIISYVINYLRDHGNSSIRSELKIYSKKRQSLRGKTYPELNAALTIFRLQAHDITWQELEKVFKNSRDWWSVSKIFAHIQTAAYGIPSVDQKMWQMMSHQNSQVALMAADKFTHDNFNRNQRSVKNLNMPAQILLKEHGKIERIQTRVCYVRQVFDEIILKSASHYEWKTFLDIYYPQVLRKMRRWKSYYELDPTAWVNMTDVFLDFCIDRIAALDNTIGHYTLGSLGSFLNSHTSRFATKYPKTHATALFVHELRLQTDLSHSRVHSTKKYTRFIHHKERSVILKKLSEAFMELNDSGHL